MAKTARVSVPRIEIGLACDAGTSNAGVYGLTDLFTYAGEFAAKRHGGAAAVVRITHWRADHDGTGVRCEYDSCPGSPHALSLLVIPGNAQAPERKEEMSPLLHWLREKHAEGVVLAAVCGGVFILARTGLLAGRQATTHWSFNEAFAEQFPDVLTETDHMVIDYGDVVTAGGVLAWADLGLRLTERFLGTAVMLETARFMLVDPPGREQRFYSEFDPRTKHGDRAILRAQLWLLTQRERPVSIADLAQHADLEQRTFLRRFVVATGMKPSEYQQRLRITRAREMLEFSQASIEEISWSLGYGDVAGFRRVFRKVMGLTPSDYRRRFCQPALQRAPCAPAHPGPRLQPSLVEEE
ncbi:GlxA family transcriptional regulator [Paraburkholderia sp. J76]|uniref:GlxA family transcriptional regulator n=1 Tax=Paraburkholderia sp. J76 TaxID=2805439 RepID=UPI002ABD4C04|nr:GlxA family transcriptional regulator [Paraburkholderia sp. J76]